ncbi:MAG: hypothetical protein ACFCUX_01935 [Candidatus Methylacidiphilales bacterium]
MKISFIWGLAAALLVIWLISAAGMKAARDRVASADRVLAMVTAQNWDETTGANRQRALEEIADEVNRLDFEQRRELGLRRGLDGLFSSLSTEERQQFLDKTLPKGFEQIIERFNRMDTEARKAAVERAMADLRDIEINASQEERQRVLDRYEDGTAQRVIREGFSSYLQNASAETKLDLAPLIEQIQRNMQGLGYR